ncbi:MAG: BMP family ABC transporter substrate-binding protein [Chloroflexi bacterium]|nr:BMP family ABC transporter substrate-binding protein [Chloroflexota bacterium]
MPRRLLSAALTLLVVLCVACASTPSVRPGGAAGVAERGSVSRAAAGSEPANAPPPVAGTPAPADTNGGAREAGVPAPPEAAAGPETPRAGASPAPERTNGSPSALRIGLVTDVGSVDDNGFHQSAWEGVLRAQRQLGAQVTAIETTDPKDYARHIDQLVRGGSSVVVTVGFALGEATREASTRYPQVRFIGVDQPQGKIAHNLAGLIFEDDKAGYLAGALAGLLTRTNVIGAVLSTDLLPPVVKLGKGFEAGAKAVNPDARVLTAYHPGGLVRGFVDPRWGKATAIQQMQQGADVIFGAGGTTGVGALMGAFDANVLAIGADADQWETVPDARPVLVSSALRQVGPGVFALIGRAVDGTFVGGNVQGEVGLAPFHDAGFRVPDQAAKRIEQIEAGLANGAVRTGVHLP